MEIVNDKNLVVSNITFKKSEVNLNNIPEQNNNLLVSFVSDKLTADKKGNSIETIGFTQDDSFVKNGKINVRSYDEINHNQSSQLKANILILKQHINKLMSKLILFSDDKKMLGLLKHQILDNAEKALSSNNTVDIALYNSLTKKVVDELKEDKFNIKSFVLITHSKDNIDEIITSVRNGNLLTESDKGVIETSLTNLGADNLLSKIVEDELTKNPVIKNEINPEEIFERKAFKNYSDALKMANISKGMEVIIDNQDGTFGIEEVSLKKVEEILTNKENYKNYVSIVSPYQMHGIDVKGNSENTNFELKLNSIDSSYNIKDFKKSIDRSNTKNIDWMFNFDNKINNEQKSTNTEKINFELNKVFSNSRELLKKVESGNLSTIEDIDSLKNQLKTLLNNSEQLKVNSGDQEKIKNFIQNLDKLSEVDSKIKSQEADYEKNKVELKNQVTRLNEKINRLKAGFPPLNGDQQNFLNMLDKWIFQKFINEIMASEDQGQITLYTVFLKKILDKAEKMTSKDLANMMKEYNNISVIMAKKVNNKEITVEEKEIVAKYFEGNKQNIDTVNNYFHDNKENSSIKTDPNNQKVPEKGFAYSDSQIKAMERVKDSSLKIIFRKTINSDGTSTSVFDEMNKLNLIVDKTVNSFNKLVELKTERKNILEVLTNQSKDISLIVENSKKEYESFIKDYIYQVITEYIEKAQQMEDSLNLEVDSGSANIVELLEKFRDIIRDLDIKTKETIYKEIVNKMIDDKFSNYLKENKERMSAIEKLKDIITNDFKNSSEVKISNMPEFIKNKSFFDELSKLAFMSLSA